MDLFSYIIASDTGFAPNPFHGWCTLACCKPVIRRTAGVGDFVVGISPKSEGNRVVWAMRIGEVLTFFRPPARASKMETSGYAHSTPSTTSENSSARI